MLTVMSTFFLAWTTAMAQTKWSSLDWNERFYTLCTIGALITANLIAFTDKTAGQVAKGQLPFDNGNTDHFTKTVSTTTAVVQQTTEPVPDKKP